MQCSRRRCPLLLPSRHYRRPCIAGRRLLLSARRKGESDLGAAASPPASQPQPSPPRWPPLRRRSLRRRRRVAHRRFLSRLAPGDLSTPAGRLATCRGDKREREKGGRGKGRERVLTWHPYMWVSR
uniref:Uncharacterized protein n=1 Tax=Oryza rufipogon TaxID=4529 RepID=A0A0E0PX55_ORYRU